MTLVESAVSARELKRMASRSSSRSIDHPKLQLLLDDAKENAEERVKNMFTGSKLFSRERHCNIPSFRMSEFNLGSILGMGEFCEVESVSNIDLIDHDTSVYKKYDIFPSSFEKGDDIESKKKMMSNCSLKKGKGEKYVVKRMKESVRSTPSLFQQGVIDLTIETQILSVVDHVNIIKLRGFNKEAMFQPSYFIVLDRLYATLHDKMEDWATKSNSKLTKIVGRRKVSRIKEKLNIAASLSSALSYIHTLRIVHRDLKPDNIGFDYKGVLKIFDFGLSIEMRREKMNSNGLYKMTGSTGSRRYMAPEVAREEPYNHTVDIYSLGILLWEMMALKRAFDGYTLETHDVLVVQVGERPKIDSSWPEPVSTIIEECWDHDWRMRPNTDTMYLTLKTLIDTL